MTQNELINHVSFSNDITTIGNYWILRERLLKKVSLNEDLE